MVNLASALTVEMTSPLPNSQKPKTEVKKMSGIASFIFALFLCVRLCAVCIDSFFATDHGAIEMILTRPSQTQGVHELSALKGLKTLNSLTNLIG